jgi:hypothetical protein
MQTPDKEKRLKVYKDVLEFLENSKKDEDTLGMKFASAQGLCLLLPLFEGIKWNEKISDFEGCSWIQTASRYPEFDSYYNNGNDDEYRYNIEYRIKILKEIISQWT